MLTEIHRQAAESAIIRLATMARQGEPIGFGRYDDYVWKMRKQDVSPDQALRGGQVICGMNATRLQLNNVMRRAAGFGHAGWLPSGPDEKIICLKNQNDIGLINGMFLTLSDVVDEATHYFSAVVTDEDGNRIGAPQEDGSRARLRIYTPLNRAIASLWMISAVARIMQPGCKADHMLILEGPQGIRKSTALKLLASDAWFTDELAEIGSKDAAQQMRGVWIIEMAELDAIGRAEVSRIKAFLTRTSDRYRPPYERYVVTVPRQCVFAGSVNPDTYLRDETGNRRFWPIRCGEIDLDALQRDRDQLWAEAVHRFNEGAPWWLEDRNLVGAVAVEQEARYEPDAWDALIERWLSSERRSVNVGNSTYENWQDHYVPRQEPLRDVSVGEVLEQALRIEPAKWTRADQMRVSSLLKAKKWERYRAINSSNEDVSREWRYRAPQAGGTS